MTKGFEDDDYYGEKFFVCFCFFQIKAILTQLLWFELNVLNDFKLCWWSRIMFAVN